IDCLHAGTPMLASALGEVAQMLDADGTPAGHLFPLQDWEIPIDKLAQDIANCAPDADYLKTLRGKVAAAAEKFRPDIMCDHYDEVYVRLHRKRAEDGMC
ncbi:MAG: glycosyltransferase, partial [Planctomycetota bacterium]